jgi:hypothetical protein
MLDVHAPEHRVGGVRDFFIHLFTITCGLLIALALEGSVEALHHRHQRMEAEQKIREEIRRNQRDLEQAKQQFAQERTVLVNFIVLLRNVSQGKPAPAKQFDLRFDENEIPEAAWETAKSNGVLEYLSYDEVERFADAYREQALLQQMEEETLEDYLELTPMSAATDGHDFSKDDAQRLLPLALRTFSHMNGMQAAGEDALQSYRTALQ